ncbi:MAG TPA: hypothetical protein VFT98_06540 [Myxococcota bacterium]|nr:hypothetical protein [Myxococcota bacterium]
MSVVPPARQLIVLARFGDAASADALVAFLGAHDIDARVEGVDPLAIGLGGRFRVVLAEEDLRRARWALDNADSSDTEAWFLATGELDPDAARRAFAKDEERPARRMRSAVRNAAIALVIVIAIAALLSR